MQCIEKGTTFVLTADPNVLCSGPDYDQLIKYSYMALVVYGFGIPVLFCIILIRYRCVTLGGRCMSRPPEHT